MTVAHLISDDRSPQAGSIKLIDTEPPLATVNFWPEAVARLVISHDR